MKYRILGGTGMKVSVVGVGAWQFGGEWGRDFSVEEVGAILGAAKDCGINLVDTAECYGDHLSESLIGKALGSDRDAWIVATKFGHKFTGHMQRTEHWTPEEVCRQLDESLRALKTDRIDLYQFHSGENTSFDTEGLWEALAGEVEKGKIGHLGISITPATNLYQVEAVGRVNAEAVQVYYNRLEPAAEKDVLPACQKQNLGVLARVPLASGFLSGKYGPGTTFPATDVRAGRSPEALAETLECVAEIQRDEVPEGVDMAAWALAWCLKHPAVTCVIPGCKNPAQVAANAAAADLDIVPDDHPQAA